MRYSAESRAAMIQLSVGDRIVSNTVGIVNVRILVVQSAPRVRLVSVLRTEVDAVVRSRVAIREHETSPFVQHTVVVNAAKPTNATSRLWADLASARLTVVAVVAQ
jgi:hypothetical protein